MPRQRKCVECGTVYFLKIPELKTNPGCLFCGAPIVFVMSMIQVVLAMETSGAVRIGFGGAAAIHMAAAIAILYGGIRLARRHNLLSAASAEARRSAFNPPPTGYPTQSPTAATQASELPFTFNCQQCGEAVTITGRRAGCVVTCNHCHKSVVAVNNSQRPESA